MPNLPDRRDSMGLDTPQPANSGEYSLLGKKQTNYSNAVTPALPAVSRFHSFALMGPESMQ